MLSLAQKTAIRRHLGIPFAGTAQAGRLYGFRFTWFNEDVEYRMNNMQPQEEQLITGVSLGSWQIDGNPTIGDVLTFTLTDATPRTVTATYTVKASDFSAPPNPVNPSLSSPLYSIALNASIAINAQIQQYGYNAVGAMPADLFSPQYLAPYYAEIIVQNSTPGVSFTLTCTSGTTTNVYTENPGSLCPVRSSIIDAATGTATAIYGYITICDYLSNLMSTANLSLQFESASVTSFRADEVHARKKLYNEYCNQLKRVIGGQDYVKAFGLGSSAGATA